jgi:phosphatidylglycerophosphate synthase
MKQFVFWAFLVILVTIGLIKTFRTKKAERSGSKEMNLRKGFKRLVFILSLIPALIGIAVFIAGLVDEDDDMLIGGLLTTLIGFVAIWAIYGVVLYIIKGFNSHHCENCEKNIGKLEEQFKFSA